MFQPPKHLIGLQNDRPLFIVCSITHNTQLTRYHKVYKMIAKRHIILAPLHKMSSWRKLPSSWFIPGPLVCHSILSRTCLSKQIVWSGLLLGENVRSVEIWRLENLQRRNFFGLILATSLKMKASSCLAYFQIKGNRKGLQWWERL